MVEWGKKEVDTKGRRSSGSRGGEGALEQIHTSLQYSYEAEGEGLCPPPPKMEKREQNKK